MIKLIYDNLTHKNIRIEQFNREHLVESNVYFIMHSSKGVLLDPGGQKAFNKIITSLTKIVKLNNIDTIFLSHQDPDVVAAINAWLRVTGAKVLCADKWQRFIPHFGVEMAMADKFTGIPDLGMILELNGCKLEIIPAHFLHSVANFQIYDPISKVLYSGDLASSIDAPYEFVDDFSQHIAYMEGFHRRYMLSNRALKLWLERVSLLDIEIIAPQHGAIIKGKHLVNQFFEWCAQLQCGIDIFLDDLYKIPK